MKLLKIVFFFILSFQINCTELEVWNYFLERDVLFHDAFYLSSFRDEYTLNGSPDIITDINEISEDYREIVVEATDKLNLFIEEYKLDLLDYELLYSMSDYTGNMDEIILDQLIYQIDGAFRIEGGFSYFQTFYLERELTTENGYKLTLGRFNNNAHGIYHWALITPGAVNNLYYYINPYSKVMNFDTWYAETNIKIVITVQYQQSSTLTLFIYKLDHYEQLSNN